MKKKKIVIAHRGACGYLPEHTLLAKVMAYNMGADFIEQDVVITKDDRAVIVHDHNHLDSVTNVSEIFPDRRRGDGLYYVIDFTLDELRQLDVHERINLETGKVVYPDRFPRETVLKLKIPTLEEEIELVQGLNKSTGKNIGIYPELKAPDFHTREGKDIAGITLSILEKYGYTKQDSLCYLQCFDPACIKHIRDDLRCRLPVVQLIAENDWNEIEGVDYGRMLTERGLDEIAKYADGIGPWMEQVITDRGNGKAPKGTDLVRWAHDRYLVVHPFTVRVDSLPPFATNIDRLFRLLYKDMEVEGVFTDFPDLALQYLEKNGLRNNSL